MSKLLYRGVGYNADQKPAQSLAEQMRRVDLVYRGVAHDGVRPVASEQSASVELFYRGHRYA